jgi:hypothetical protein
MTSRPEPASKRPGTLRRLFRVARWASFAVSLTALVMILIPSSPPDIAIPPEAPVRAEAKVQEFRSSVEQGRASKLEMDQSELNAWLGSNLALNRVQATPAAEAAPSADKDPGSRPAPSAAAVQGSVRDVKIELHGETLRAYASFDLHGKELSLELEGRLVVRDGCLRLEPTGGKLGSLPLPASTLESAAERIFESAENREKFRLPPEIRDVAVRDGRLVVSSR